MGHDLEGVAATLVADGKGILAADETVPTLTRRFDKLGIESLKAWHGRDEDLKAGQEAPYHRARCNGAATLSGRTPTTSRRRARRRARRPSGASPRA